MYLCMYLLFSALFRTSSFSSDDSLCISLYIYPRPQDFILLLLRFPLYISLYLSTTTGLHPSPLTIPSIYLALSIHDHRTSSFSSDDSLYISRFIYPRPQDFILLL